MDLTLLSAALRELLTENKSVVLPGIGTFIIEEVAPTFLNGGKTITPPSQKITFSAAQMQNDGKLEVVFAREAALPLQEGEVQMALLIEKIRASIRTNRVACIPEFGTISQDSDYQFHFTPDKSFLFSPDYYLLEPISLKPEEGEFEEFVKSSHSTSPISPVPPEEESSEKEMWIIKDGEPMPEEEAMFNTESEQLAAESDAPEDPAETSPATGATTPEESAIAPTPAVSPMEQPNEPVPTVTPTHPTPSPIAPPAPTPTPITLHRSRKGLWITLSALAILLLACILIYIFRTELTPVLEKLLYTKEELEILRQAGR